MTTEERRPGTESKERTMRKLCLVISLMAATGCSSRVSRTYETPKVETSPDAARPTSPLGVEGGPRFFAVSDVYDALISLRPYRPVSYDNRTALEEITGMAERNEIGWDVVKALIAHNRKDKPHYSEVAISTEKRGTPPGGNVYGVTAEQ